MPKRRPEHPDSVIEAKFRELEQQGWIILYMKGLLTLWEPTYTLYRPDGTEAGPVNGRLGRSRADLQKALEKKK